MLRLVRVKTDPLPELAFTAAWLAGPESYALKVIAQLVQSVAAKVGNGNLAWI